MAARCATLAEFVDLIPEFLTLGDKSTGTVVLAAQPVPGDSVTFTDPYAFPPLSETYVAGTDFAIGATVDDTATNLAAALAAGALLDSTTEAQGDTVYLVSTKTGPAGFVGLTTSVPATFQFSGTELTGGAALVEFSLGCACSMINLECWGTKASCASVYLAAHMLDVAGGNESGPVERKKIDKIEIQYAATAATSDASFGSTKYGRLYLAMRKTVFVAPIAGRRVPVRGIIACRWW